MYFDNTKAKGEFTHEGCVADVFKKMANIIETNDGTRSFEWVTAMTNKHHSTITKKRESL